MADADAGELLYGCKEALPEAVPLRAGPLTLVFEAGDLRYIRYGDDEIVASFKTYSTPLSRPWPAEIAAGTRVEQCVTLKLVGARTTRMASGLSAGFRPWRHCPCLPSPSRVSTGI